METGAGSFNARVEQEVAICLTGEAGLSCFLAFRANSVVEFYKILRKCSNAIIKRLAFPYK